MAEIANVVNALKVASGLLLNQKNVAFFKEEGYEEGNGLLNALGIDTNTVLGGIFSGTTEEILVGGKGGESLGSAVNAVLAFLLEVEPLQAQGGRATTVFSHPLEWNVRDKKAPSAQNFVTEHIIENPATFTAVLVMPSMLYTSVFQELKTLLSKGTLVVITAKGEVYRNMILTNFSPAYTVEQIGRIVIATTWREAQMVYPEAKQSSDPNS